MRIAPPEMPVEPVLFGGSGAAPGELPEDGGSLPDRIVRLPQRRTRSRKPPFSGPAREVRAGTDAGKALRLLSDDPEAPARDGAGSNGP